MCFILFFNVNLSYFWGYEFTSYRRHFLSIFVFWLTRITWFGRCLVSSSFVERLFYLGLDVIFHLSVSTSKGINVYLRLKRDKDVIDDKTPFVEIYSRYYLRFLNKIYVWFIYSCARTIEHHSAPFSFLLCTFWRALYAKFNLLMMTYLSSMYIFDNNHFL